MPRFTFRTVPSAMAACAALLPLHGCFGSDPGEDRYTEPAGEVFESLRFELDASGRPHILAQAGMLYRRTGPLEQWETEAPIILRNYQTIHYTLSQGGYRDHPFRNALNRFTSSAVLLPDITGRLHALIMDGGRVNQFSLAEGDPDWMGRFDLGLNDFFDWFLGGESTHGRSTALALDSGTSLIYQKRDGQGRYTIHDGGRKLRLDSTGYLQSCLLQATPSFRVFVAVESFEDADRGVPAGVMARTVYYRWRAGDATARKAILADGGVPWCALVPHREGYRLHILDGPEVRVFALGADGAPTERSPLALPSWLEGFAGAMAADGDGCLHGMTMAAPKGDSEPPKPDLPRIAGPSMERGFTLRSWNSCRPEWIDSLVLAPPPDTALQASMRAGLLRVDGEGRPWFAFVTQENRRNDFSGRIISHKSWIGLASYREDGWMIDTVAVK